MSDSINKIANNEQFDDADFDPKDLPPLPNESEKKKMRDLMMDFLENGPKAYVGEDG